MIGWQALGDFGKRRIAWIALSVLGAYYMLLLTNGDFRPFRPEFLGLAFNSQFLNMLQGAFNVDPLAIGLEAFVRDGKVYTYFGIFPSLLRGVFAPFVDLQHTDVSRASCIAATLVVAVFQVKMFRVARVRLVGDPKTNDLYVFVLLSLLLGGPQIFLLAAAPIYHEPILWAAAFCSIFNYFLLSCAFDGSPIRVRRFAVMALLAGVCLITRATEGIALYLALSILLAQAWTRAARSGCEPDAGKWCRGTGDWALSRWSILVPLLILIIFGLAQLGINHARWGDPLKLIDFRSHAYMMSNPKRVKNLDEYGPLHFSRVPHNVAYYLAASREEIQFFNTLWPTSFDGKEMTNAPMALHSPLVLILAGFGLWRVLTRNVSGIPCPSVIGIGLLGLSFPVLFLLGYMWLAVRFHMDFMPFLSLAAVVGFHQLGVVMASSTVATRRVVGAVSASLCGIGIAYSHIALAAYKLQFISMDHATTQWILKWWGVDGFS